MSESQEVDLGQLLVALAPQIDIAEIQEQEGAWVACFDDELMVLLELDTLRHCLVMTTELGLPLLGSEAALHKQLLQLAARWRDMVGVRMGLDPEDDMVLQIADLCLHGLTVECFKTHLLSFAETARHARIALSGFDGGGARLAIQFIRA